MKLDFVIDHPHFGIVFTRVFDPQTQKWLRIEELPQTKITQVEERRDEVTGVVDPPLTEGTIVNVGPESSLSVRVSS